MGVVGVCGCVLVEASVLCKAFLFRTRYTFRDQAQYPGEWASAGVRYTWTRS